MTESFDKGAAETTEVWYGNENIIIRALKVLSEINIEFNVCIGTNGPYAILSTEPIKNAYFDLKNKGVSIKIITEVTKENISYCRQLMQIANIRHLDGIKGNFAVGDRMQYGATAIVQGVQPPMTQHIL